MIPFAPCERPERRLAGLNLVGMMRRNFSRERLAAAKIVLSKLFHGPGVFADRLNEVRHLADSDPAIAEILGFIDAGKHRELCQPVKAGKRSYGHSAGANHDKSGSG